MRRATVAFVTTLTLASAASAQTTPAPRAAAAPTPATATATTPTAATTGPRVDPLAPAAQAYVARDYDRALTLYRQASLDPATASGGHLGIGYTQNARGDRTAALAAFREALSWATRSGNDLDRARALIAIAMTDEASSRWDEALVAWQDVTRFADGHTPIVDPAVGRQRIEAIHRREQSETASAQVRMRIEERRRAAANPAPPTP